MTLPLKKTIIYGPVNSRRLGSSLGINLLPTQFKLCTFNCLYCQYGWTRVHARTPKREEHWPAAPEILDAVEQALKTILPRPAYLTFSGNGEPSLHPNFAELVDGLIELRNDYLPQSKTAILSNSAAVADPAIRQAISKLDVRIMKLDCGTEYMFHRYNRPCRGVTLKAVVSGLRAMENITIQSLFADGSAGNYKPDNLKAWTKKLKEISPIHVQLYTLDRGYPSNKIYPLTKEKLLAIKSRLEEEKIPAEVY
jgi:wyosine [tRNA(Phe)-imidazoG37] synthetase (radical SAM superfamily)